MALYIPASRRRRQTIVFVVAALVVGLVVGVLAGRASVPSVTDQRALRTGECTADRVGTAGPVAAPGGGHGVERDRWCRGAELVLQRTRDELQGEFSNAPWLDAAARQQLLDELGALDAQTDRNTPAFGSGAEALASHIEATFGLRQ